MEEQEKNKANFEDFLEKNKLTLGFLLLGLILIGLGVLGKKVVEFNSGPKVEILGSETKEVGSESGIGSGGEELTKITAEASGEVMKPGVYQLPIESRVNDLLTMAGGLSSTADRDWAAKNINLAQKLVDGAKIYVPKKGGEGEVRSGTIEAGSGSVKLEKININTASEKELDSLWGVGPATAEKIISGRPYQKPEELLEKKIVKSNVWEQIKEKITIF